eukprot:9368752-Ditylum_brightwellii.AAC.1
MPPISALRMQGAEQEAISSSATCPKIPASPKNPQHCQLIPFTPSVKCFAILWLLQLKQKLARCILMQEKEKNSAQPYKNSTICNCPPPI